MDEFARDLFAFLMDKYNIVLESDAYCGEIITGLSDKFDNDLGYAVMVVAYTFRDFIHHEVHYLDLLETSDGLENYVRRFALVASLDYTPLKFLGVCAVVSEMFAYRYYRREKQFSLQRFFYPAVECLSKIFQTTFRPILAKEDTWPNIRALVPGLLSYYDKFLDKLEGPPFPIWTCLTTEKQQMPNLNYCKISPMEEPIWAARSGVRYTTLYKPFSAVQMIIGEMPIEVPSKIHEPASDSEDSNEEIIRIFKPLLPEQEIKEKTDEEKLKFVNSTPEGETTNVHGEIGKENQNVKTESVPRLIEVVSFRAATEPYKLIHSEKFSQVGPIPVPGGEEAWKRKGDLKTKAKMLTELKNSFIGVTNICHHLQEQMSYLTLEMYDEGIACGNEFQEMFELQEQMLSKNPNVSAEVLEEQVQFLCKEIKTLDKAKNVVPDPKYLQRMGDRLKYLSNEVSENLKSIPVTTKAGTSRENSWKPPNSKSVSLSKKKTSRNNKGKSNSVALKSGEASEASAGKTSTAVRESQTGGNTSCDIPEGIQPNTSHNFSSMPDKSDAVLQEITPRFEEGFDQVSRPGNLRNELESLECRTFSDLEQPSVMHSPNTEVDMIRDESDETAHVEQEEFNLMDGFPNVQQNMQSNTLDKQKEIKLHRRTWSKNNEELAQWAYFSSLTMPLGLEFLESRMLNEDSNREGIERLTAEILEKFKARIREWQDETSETSEDNLITERNESDSNDHFDFELEQSNTVEKLSENFKDMTEESEDETSCSSDDTLITVRRKSSDSNESLDFESDFESDFNAVEKLSEELESVKIKPDDIFYEKTKCATFNEGSNHDHISCSHCHKQTRIVAGLPGTSNSEQQSIGESASGFQERKESRYISMELLPDLWARLITSGLRIPGTAALGTELLISMSRLMAMTDYVGLSDKILIDAWAFLKPQECMELETVELSDGRIIVQPKPKVDLPEDDASEEKDTFMKRETSENTDTEQSFNSQGIESPQTNRSSYVTRKLDLIEYDEQLQSRVTETTQTMQREELKEKGIETPQLCRICSYITRLLDDEQLQSRVTETTRTMQSEETINLKISGRIVFKN